MLQRRSNHDTFRIYSIETESQPELVDRFGIGSIPTLVVVENKCVRGSLPNPRGCREIEQFLAPWLR